MLCGVIRRRCSAALFGGVVRRLYEAAEFAEFGRSGETKCQLIRAEENTKEYGKMSGIKECRAIKIKLQLFLMFVA